MKPLKPPTKLKRRNKLLRPPMDPILRLTIVDRSGYMCDLCRRPLSEYQWECHHRQLRGQGGSDSLSNLLALHFQCHQHIHLHPTWAKAHGFLVPPWHDPVVWRVWRWRAVWMAPGAEWELADRHPDQGEGFHG